MAFLGSEPFSILRNKKKCDFWEMLIAEQKISGLDDSVKNWWNSHKIFNVYKKKIV